MIQKKSKIRTRDLVLLSLLIAVEVVLTRFFAFENSYLRISLSYIPLMLMAHLFGPWLAGIGGVVGDVIGMLLFPKALYFPGFTLNAFLVPFIYGWVLYRHKITLTRIITVQVLVLLSVSLVLTPLWLHIMYKLPIVALFPVRLLKSAMTLPINTAISYYLFNKTALERFIVTPRHA